MEANGVVLRQSFGFSYCAQSSCSKELKSSIFVGRKGPKREVLLSGFCDQGHLQYYNSNHGSNSAGRVMIMSEKKDEIKKMKKKKKQLKLLKGLTRDLSTFSQMGFGLDLDSDHGLVDEIKGNMISEAAELLLEQLKKLKAEEKELKKKMKEEKRRLKAANTCEMSSSSSSSESSDSECGEIVDMKSLKTAQKIQNPQQQVIEEPSSSYPAPIIPVLPNTSSSQPDENINVLNMENKCNFSKKIEVCMGGKCKKSGAGILLDEFQRVVGIEGAVSGCKCMGKCRDGPNIKVVDEDNESVRVATDSMCIGVGLEDVNMIVANLLGENCNQLGFAAALRSLKFGF